MRELRRIGCLPRLLVITWRPTHGDAQRAEREWIRKLRALGCDLTNGTPGGDGGPTTLGRRLSPMALAKRASRRGETHEFSPEMRELFSTAARQRFAGKPLSPEHRRKIGDAQKGKAITSEHREAVSRANKGRLAHRHWRIESGKRVWYGAPSDGARRCRCGSLGPFYKNRASPDGLTSLCQECTKAAKRRPVDGQ